MKNKSRHDPVVSMCFSITSHTSTVKCYVLAWLLWVYNNSQTRTGLYSYSYASLSVWIITHAVQGRNHNFSSAEQILSSSGLSRSYQSSSGNRHTTSNNPWIPNDRDHTRQLRGRSYVNFATTAKCYTTLLQRNNSKKSNWHLLTAFVA